MQSNTYVIANVLKWLQEGESVWLSSITSTWGSSPAPSGTLMAYCEKYGIAGTLSGGCIEQDLVEKMQQGTLLADQKSQTYPIEMVYGGTPEQQARFVLPCGGQLHLLVEYLQPIESTISHFTQLNDCLTHREMVARKVDISTGDLAIVHSKTNRGIARIENENSSAYVEHAMGPTYQMLLIGASEVARCVAELAQPLDFAVSVWDHREEFLRNWNVADVEVYRDSPEVLIREKFADESNVIIALAHDPRVDDFALVDALTTQAFYIGAIGSKTTCKKRNERLVNYVDDITSLDKMHSPVGLDIGSKTPFEIAISVLAHVIQARSQLEKRLGK